MKPIDLDKLRTEFHSLDHVKYLWGSKPSNSLPASQIKTGDCSWFTRRIFALQGIDIPEGSVSQRDWFLANAIRKSYDDVLKFTCNDPGRLFAAGFDHTQPGKPRRRHIWLLSACRTIECGSSIGGVGSRPAENFLSLVQWCVEIPVL